MVKTTYAVAPGEFLAEWLEEQGMSQGELARRMDVSAKHVSSLINGGSLTAETAVKLERVTGSSAQYWLRLEAQHRADLIRLTEAKTLESEDLTFLKNVPCKELRKRGFLSATLANRPQLVQELMSFFRAGSVFALQERIRLPQAAYRQGQLTDSKEPIVATWLRLGELDVDQQEPLPQFSSDALRALIPEIRSLTRQPPSHFGAALVSRLGTAGVHLVYVQDIPGSATYGATWWKNENPVIQLSLRQKDDGQFWFTLFHEIGHVLLHAKRHRLFVDLKNGADSGAAEAEADRFACEVLIPKEHEHRLVSNMSLAAISDFAQEIGVSPGVVVGRLQHDRKIGFHVGNRLKIQLAISEDDD
ncbi:HigA family addiction module antitoxin [Pseudarthrobacter sp. LMD1-1-1.1]|uniref:HigA family addiction module antitoxin n=1 Tax=Pseudarthrobacter sp. LMD1-1-1.1 TaxID=3135242 RepID=UPI0034360DF1